MTLVCCDRTLFLTTHYSVLLRNSNGPRMELGGTPNISSRSFNWGLLKNSCPLRRLQSSVGHASYGQQRVTPSREKSCHFHYYLRTRFNRFYTDNTALEAAIYTFRFAILNMICALVEEISYLVTILRTHASSLKSSDALLQK